MFHNSIIIIKRMDTTKKILVGISGGLDSAFTAYILKKRGYKVEGVHFSNGIVPDETVEIIKKISDFLAIPIRTVDIRDKFEELIHDVDVEMCHMRTPNICVMCARDIKFGHILGYAIENGYDYMATGHYVKIIRYMGDIIVQMARDETRDQSYGFSVIPKNRLTYVLTPLGEYLKTSIRQEAIATGLPFIQKESHGICFIHEPFGEFYKKNTKYGIKRGNFIVDGTNVVMPHAGQQLYTRGQKVTLGKKHCVVDKKTPEGDIILTKKENVYETRVKINRLNFMIEREKIIRTKPYSIMIRYNSFPVGCRIIGFYDDTIEVETVTPVFAPTPGQIGTIYDGDTIIVGGFIYLE